MDNYIFSQVNKITDCMDDLPYTDIPALIRKLGDPDGLTRMQVREALICFGKSAVPDLTGALSTSNSQVRWQIIKVLESIHDPGAAAALVEPLKDENAGIRWAACNALIELQRACIPPLLEALIRDFDSLWLRQSAHHILHVLKDTGKLTAAEEKVFEALEDVEPASAVPWAAEKALEALLYKKMIASQ